MDWELKASSAWDFTDIASEGSLVGSSGGDFSVDLKLGGLGGTGDDKGRLPKYPFDASSPSGSSKKARAINGNQNVTCLVDGCMADLSGCREYHRRHRVCERHSKTPVVFVRGKEQRFCQQCSRFQSLAEFDEEKRSCRKRLAGHNRRRRKPQPEALYINHGSFLSNHHQGSSLLQFSGPEPPYTTSAVPTWPCVTQHASVPHLSDKRFPFLLANDPERGNSSHQLAVPQVNNNVHPHHRSHSLLSSPRLFQPSPFGSPSTHQQQTGQSSSMQFDCPAHHQYPRSIPASVVPQASIYENSYSGNELKMVSLSPDDLLEKGASQVLPYTWK